MAPFRRGRSSQPAPTGGPVPRYEEGEDDHNDAAAADDGRMSAWEARRRRKAAAAKGGIASASPAPTRSTSSRRRPGGKESLPDDEYDPYDSDPGESYREHCDRLKGERSRSCLAMPRFLKDKNLLLKLDRKVVPDPSVATSPPSPLQSELGDGGSPLSHLHPAGGLPASLPRDLARVRYSLRTSIGDGTDVQPHSGSPSMMDRRELRPNNVHINVSHWSDFGGRNYMEDR
jgi:hypothetical protein